MEKTVNLRGKESFPPQARRSLTSSRFRFSFWLQPYCRLDLTNREEDGVAQSHPAFFFYGVKTAAFSQGYIKNIEVWGSGFVRHVRQVANSIKIQQALKHGFYVVIELLKCCFNFPPVSRVAHHTKLRHDVAIPKIPV